MVVLKLIGSRGRWLLAAAVFVLVLSALAPALDDQPQHGDEAQYGWAAGYYGRLIADLDYRAGGVEDFADPGWYPYAYWNSLSNLSTVYTYAIALGVTRTDPPREPYSYTDRNRQGPETLLSDRAMSVLRFTAMLCAALGLALISRRFGLVGASAAIALLLIPHVRGDISRAWAEGPLLLGFGLCATTYGTRAFAPAVGLATTFKLTGLGLWPLALIRRVNGGISPLRGFLLAATTWTVLMPQSWPAFGPFQLVYAVWMRWSEHDAQSSEAFFLPTRYWIPFELLGLLLVGATVSRLTQVARNRRRKSLSLRAGLKAGLG